MIIGHVRVNDIEAFPLYEAHQAQRVLQAVDRVEVLVQAAVRMGLNAAFPCNAEY